MQLAMEYEPSPPFDAGTPERAGAEIVSLTMNAIAKMMAHGMDVAERASATGSPG